MIEDDVSLARSGKECYPRRDSILLEGHPFVLQRGGSFPSAGASPRDSAGPRTSVLPDTLGNAALSLPAPGGPDLDASAGAHGADGARSPRVLIVDDDPAVRKALAGVLLVEGFDVVVASDGETGLSQVQSLSPKVVILDLRMPGLDGLETLRRLKATAAHVPVIILTGYGDIRSAVQAMRLGAYDYLTKPPQHTSEVVMAVRRAVERYELGAEIEGLRGQLRERGHLRWLMGPSPGLQHVVDQVRQVAESTFTVLVQGETGAGKELVARAIHELSARRERPFVALDCGAIPDTLIESELFGYERGAFTGADRRKDGHFQLAEGGSLFLDEISNLPLATQAKLLRVLQERHVHVLGGKSPMPVDVRIIASANVPLDREARAGRFRQDLYYRLSEFVIVVPPLRERREDIVDLARRFLAEASMELRRPVQGLSDEALQLLLQHPWPGNVRELRNVIRRAVLSSGDLIRPQDLTALAPPASEAPAAVDPGASVPSLKESADMAAAAAERQAIRRALESARGNKSEAARILRTDFKTLHLKMKRYAIRAGDFLIS
jgi:DNA-binding NtrC family response regulator